MRKLNSARNGGAMYRGLGVVGWLPLNVQWGDACGARSGQQPQI